MHTKHYEDAPEYNADAYTVKGYEGIACMCGRETEPDEDTEWTATKSVPAS